MRLTAIIAFTIAAAGCVLGASTSRDTPRPAEALARRQNIGQQLENVGDVFEGAGENIKRAFWESIRDLRANNPEAVDGLLAAVDKTTDRIRDAADEVESLARKIKYEFYFYLRQNHKELLDEAVERGDAAGDWFNHKADEVGDWVQRLVYLKVCHKGDDLDLLCVVNSLFVGLRSLGKDFVDNLDKWVSVTDDSFSVNEQSILKPPA